MVRRRRTTCSACPAAHLTGVLLAAAALVACTALSTTAALAQNPRPAPRSPAPPILRRPASPPPSVPAVGLAALETAGSNVSAGASLTATVRLDAPAPAEGTVVDVRLSNPAAASVPSRVTVTAGETTVTFDVKGSGVTTPTPLTIVATVGLSRRTATVTVEPAAAAPFQRRTLEVGAFTATFVDPPDPQGPEPFQTRTIQIGSFEATFVNPPDQ